MIDLQAIEEREKAATKGPWEVSKDYLGDGVFQEGVAEGFAIQRFDAGTKDSVDEKHKRRIQRDADFIAHARTDIPALIAEVKRLEEKQYEDQATMEHEGEAIRLHKDDRIRMDDGTIKRLEAELKRYRELAKVVKIIAVCEDWDLADSHDGLPKEKRRVVELLKEVHDAQEG